MAGVLGLQELSQVNENPSEEAKRLASETQRDGGKAVVAVEDLSKDEDVARIVEIAGSELGGVDILVNNAAGGGHQNDMETPSSWRLTRRKDCDNMRKDDRRSVDDSKEVKEVARIVKEHDVRRDEILNVAQQLFYTKGYERTSIQGIIDEIGIAKGTFYYYFGSKQELLDAIIGRMLDQTMQLIEPIVDDGQLNALEKFERLFSDAHSWKLENKAFLLVMSRILYRDENAIVRHKMKLASARSITPLLAKIIRQGVGEGAFSTDYPDDMGEIVLEIVGSLGEAVTQMLLKFERDGDALDRIERKTINYEYAIERILGAPKGSLKLFDIDKIKLWFD